MPLAGPASWYPPECWPRKLPGLPAGANRATLAVLRGPASGPGTDGALRERVVGCGGVRKSGGRGGPRGTHLTSHPQKGSRTGNSRAWSPSPLRPSPGPLLEGLACIQRSQEACFCCPQPRIWAATGPGNFNSKYGNPTGWLSGPTPHRTNEESERQRGWVTCPGVEAGWWQSCPGQGQVTPTASCPEGAVSGSCPSPRAAPTQAPPAAGWSRARQADLSTQERAPHRRSSVPAGRCRHGGWWGVCLCSLNT